MSMVKCIIKRKSYPYYFLLVGYGMVLLVDEQKKVPNKRSIIFVHQHSDDENPPIIALQISISFMNSSWTLLVPLICSRL